MISDILGLSINQKVLNKKSNSSVVSSFEKTATNYIAFGRMASDLKLIRLNFSRWLAMEGVKVRGTPDAHLLKEDELTKKFGILREKYTKSKITKVAQDGTSSNKGVVRTLLEKYINYKIERKVERKVAAAVLKRYRKLTTVRKVIRLKKKLLSIVNNLLSKINIKKMFTEWIKRNINRFIKPIIEVFSNAMKRFFKNGVKKLAVRFGTSFLASVGFSGPFAIGIAAIVTIGLMVWDPLMDAWEEYKKGGNFFETLIVGLMDEFTLGLFGKENIKEFNDSFVKWYDNLFKEMFNAIDKSMKFIEEKMTLFANFIIEKGKAMFVTKQNEGDFISAFDELNKKRLEEEQQTRDKYAKYFEQMQDAIDNKKVNIRQLEIEIATLEYNLKVLVEGPENARLEAAKIEKVKQEQELTKLEEERIKSREGGASAEKKAKKTEPPPTSAPAPAPKPAPKVESAPKPASEKKTPSATNGKYEDVKQMIIANEGYKTKPYKDSKGLWTVGVGHLIGNGKKMPVVDPKHPELGMITENRVFSPQEIYSIFDKDFKEHLQAAEKSPGWDKSNDAGKAGLIDLTYNVGPYWYKKLKDAASLLTEGKFIDAAKELEKTGWYKQVKSRAVATVSLIRSGAANDKSGSSALASVMGSTKVASAGKFIGQESTQVAQAQREQMKPKDVDVIRTAKVNNNKQTQQENVAMNKPGPDSGSILLDRASA